MKCFSNTQSGEAEGKCLSKLRHVPEGLQKVKTANNAGEIFANRSATIVEIPKSSNLPKIWHWSQIWNIWCNNWLQDPCSASRTSSGFMKTLAPAARVWSPGALVLGAARQGARARRLPSGPRRGGPSWSTRGPTTGVRLPYLQPLARRGRRSRGGQERAGNPRRCKPGALSKLTPSTRQAPASVRQTISLSVYGLLPDAGGDATRLPAAPARPPTARSARRSLHPLRGSLLRPRRPQLRPPPATQASPSGTRARPRELGRSRRQRHHVAAPPQPPTALRSARSLSPPLLWPSEPWRPRALRWVLGEDCRRKEGGRAPGNTRLGSGLAERPRLMCGECLSVTRTNRQLLEARGGEGRCGARGLGE